MKSILPIACGLAVALLLSGCVSGQNTALVQQAEMDRLDKQCKADHPVGNGRPAVPLVKCINDAEDRAYGSGGPSADLIAVRHAARVALAEKLDRGTITQAEAELEFAKLTSQAVSEEERRRNSRVSAAALVAATAPVTCTSVGGVTRCF